MNTGQLRDRVAIVSGAASGIGAAITARFRAEGATVAGLDINTGMASDHDIVVDLRSDAELGVALAEMQTAIGAPDILVHAAAMSVHGGCVDTDPGDFARIYDVNLIGAVRLLRLCVPGMRAARRGSIVFLTSINADFAAPTLAAYAASKAALNSLTRTAALELASDGIRVNAIAPASIDTPLLRASFDRAPDAEQARAANVLRHPLGRLGTTADVAELALFLASDRSSWITGGIHPIDGGAHVTRR